MSGNGRRPGRDGTGWHLGRDGAGRRPSGDGERPPRARRRPSPEARRPLLVAVGVLVVVGCALAGAEVAARVDHRAGYLALATFVPQGSLITAADLTVVSLTAGSGLAAVPESASTAVLGRRASVTLEPGSLLVPGDLTTALPLPPGDALVGTSLSTDQAPVGLLPGDAVIVVLGGQSSSFPSSSQLAGAGASASASGPSGASRPSGAGGLPVLGTGVLALGTVYAVSLQSAGVASGNETITLEVPKAAAAEVTAASAASDVSLAEISARTPA